MAMSRAALGMIARSPWTADLEHGEGCRTRRYDDLVVAMMVDR